MPAFIKSAWTDAELQAKKDGSPIGLGAAVVVTHWMALAPPMPPLAPPPPPTGIDIEREAEVIEIP